MSYKQNTLETDDAQNQLGAMVFRIYLNVENPTTQIRRQYFKTVQAMHKAQHELDLLNDMKAREDSYE